MKSLSLRITLLFVLILILSGCGMLQKQVSEIRDLEPSKMLRFRDVPYPAGFKILPKRSFMLESGKMRAGILVYTGKADAESVVRFYKAQMPIYNWALLNVLEFGDRMLNFERENEACVITVKSIGSRVEVAVSLAPKSPIVMSKERENLKEGKSKGSLKQQQIKIK